MASTGRALALAALVNAGLVPGDYPNQGAPIPERTQLTPGPMKSVRRTVAISGT